MKRHIDFKKMVKMDRIIKKYISMFRSICIGIGLIIPFASFAQQINKDSTLVRTVVVEQEYNPDVLDASKINILPAVEEPTVSKKDIEYSVELIPVNSYGNYQEILPFTRKETQPNANKGYARLGYGNKGNVDAKLSYLFDLSKRDWLGINIAVDGMNGKMRHVPSFLNPDIDLEDWKARYYRTDVNVDYVHQFDRVNLDISGNFQSDVFNYHYYDVETEGSINIPAGGEDFVSAGRQHHTKAHAHIGVNSTDEDLPLLFKLQTNYLFFDRKYKLNEKYTDREQIIRTQAEVNGEITDEQRIGIDANMYNIFYSLDGLKDYTTINLTPYYLYENESFKARLGIHVDFAFNNGKTFQISPDIFAQYTFAESYGLYLKAGGGRIINDYRQLEQSSPYFSPDLSGVLTTSYLPLDAKFGLKASPVSGFWFDIFAGYQIRNNDLCFLHNYHYFLNDAYTHFRMEDTKAFYGGIGVKYSWKDQVSFSVGGTYYSWDADETAALLMKPEFELKSDLDIKIQERLFINLGYHYMSRPEVTLYYEDYLTGMLLDSSSYQMNAISNVYVGATFKLYKGLSVYAKVNNLLNKKYEYYYSYPAQKLNFLIGASFSF